jgi:hypothetical protein
MRHHRHRHHRHCRFSHLWYWATGAAIPGAIALWWLLWAAAYGAMIATRAMWQVTQPADGSEPRWQQALDAGRPPWPKMRARRMVTR